MPNTPFFNLPGDKRNLVTSAALEAFSTTNYDEASVNQICKNSSIAKGSFYQYFTDKLDLYVYVMSLAVEAKIAFFSDALAEFDTLTLEEQIRLLFIKGLEFAREHPQYAALGEQFSKENNAQAKRAVIKAGDKQSEPLFIQMADRAKAKGEIGRGVDGAAFSLLLQALNKAVNEFMLNQSDGGRYGHFDEDAGKLVDSLLSMIFNGIKNS